MEEKSDLKTPPFPLKQLQARDVVKLFNIDILTETILKIYNTLVLPTFYMGQKIGL